MTRLLLTGFEQERYARPSYANERRLQCPTQWRNYYNVGLVRKRSAEGLRLCLSEWCQVWVSVLEVGFLAGIDVVLRLEVAEISGKFAIYWIRYIFPGR